MNSEQFLFVQFCYLYSVDGGGKCVLEHSMTENRK